MTPEDLTALAGQVPALDEEAMGRAFDRHQELAKPPGSLGKLEGLSIWLAGVQAASPPRPLERKRVVLFAGDHGVAKLGVSAHPPEITPQIVSDVLDGGSAVNVLARQADVGVRVADVSVDAELRAPTEVTRWKVCRSSGSIDREPAASAEDFAAGLGAGVTIANHEIDGGADLLAVGHLGIGSSTVATALVCAITGVEPVDAVGRRAGVSDAVWARKVAVVRDSVRRSRTRRLEPLEMLRELGGADLAALTGFLVAAAVRRTPVVLDGAVSTACALIAAELAGTAPAFFVAGHRSTEPAHRLVLEHLRLEPLLDLSLNLGAGTGALLAVPLLDSAVAVIREMTARPAAVEAEVEGEVEGEVEAT